MSDLVIFKDGGQDLMILQAYLFLGGKELLFLGDH